MRKKCLKYRQTIYQPLLCTIIMYDILLANLYNPELNGSLYVRKNFPAKPVSPSLEHACLAVEHSVPHGLARRYLVLLGLSLRGQCFPDAGDVPRFPAKMARSSKTSLPEYCVIESFRKSRERFANCSLFTLSQPCPMVVETHPCPNILSIVSFIVPTLVLSSCFLFLPSHRRPGRLI